MTSTHDTFSKEFVPLGDLTWAETAGKQKVVVDHISSSMTTTSKTSTTTSPDLYKYDDGFIPMPLFVNTGMFLHGI